MLLGDGTLLSQGKDHKINSDLQLGLIVGLALPKPPVALVRINCYKAISNVNTLKKVNGFGSSNVILDRVSDFAARRRSVKIEKDVVERVIVSDWHPESIPPQVGRGGGTPSPKKLKLVSVRIAPPKDADAIIINGAQHCGKI